MRDVQQFGNRFGWGMREQLWSRECGEELSQELGGQLEGASEAENRTPGERPLALINTSMICETTGLGSRGFLGATNRSRAFLLASESGSRGRVDQRILCGHITRKRVV